MRQISYGFPLRIRAACSAQRPAARQLSSTRASLDPCPAGRAPAANSRSAAARCSSGGGLGHLHLDLPPAQRLAVGRAAGGRSPSRRPPPPATRPSAPCRVTTVRSVSRLAMGASGWPPVTSATRAASSSGTWPLGGAERRVHLAPGPARRQLEVPARVGAAGAPPQRDLAGGEPLVGGVEVRGGQVVQHRLVGGDPRQRAERGPAEPRVHVELLLDLQVLRHARLASSPVTGKFSECRTGAAFAVRLPVSACRCTASSR